MLQAAHEVTRPAPRWNPRVWRGFADVELERDGRVVKLVVYGSVTPFGFVDVERWTTDGADGWDDEPTDGEVTFAEAQLAEKARRDRDELAQRCADARRLRTVCDVEDAAPTPFEPARDRDRGMRCEVCLVATATQTFRGRRMCLSCASDCEVDL